MSDVIYLYGFVPASTAEPPAALRGLDGAPVRLLPLGSLCAVLSEVPAAAYSGPAVEQRLEDLPWLAERGVAHERVVAWFVDHGEIVPAPLLTLYSAETALEQAVQGRLELLARELERLAGRREWDLKVSVDRVTLEAHAGSVAPAIRSLDDEIAVAPAGRRYLLERKRADMLRRELGDAARNVAGSLLAELRTFAEDSVVLSPPRGAGELPVQLAAALLVRREREPDLHEGLARAAATPSRLGFSVELTGPWAPYRFLHAEPVAPA